MSILLIGTLDTKGREIAYCRDKIRELGSDVIVLDSGILGEPLDIELGPHDVQAIGAAAPRVLVWGLALARGLRARWRWRLRSR